jgi:GNAT superfamily N-acetyltransferase
MQSMDPFSLAELVPDLPRWIEVRDLLLQGGGEITGLEREPELSFVLRDRESASVFLIGTPTQTALANAIEAILADRAGVVAPPAFTSRLAQALPAWSHSRLIVHGLTDPARLERISTEGVDWVPVADLGAFNLPADLLEELMDGGARSPIAASWVEDQPVAFCYAGSYTETLWDVSIDTLEPHRRRGHAGRCAAHMVKHMAARGRQPVWQALENNPPSWRLAAKLGFTPIDELVMFEPPETDPIG